MKSEGSDYLPEDLIGSLRSRGAEDLRHARQIPQFGGSMPTL